MQTQKSIKRENSKKEKSRVKANSGITLIALVITIIVLLILAGVALLSLTGDSGILSNSEKAKENTLKANAKEKVQIAIMEHKIGQYLEGKTLKEYLETAGATGVNEAGTEGVMDGYSFKIEDGVVTLTKGETETYPPQTGGLTPEEKVAIEAENAKNDQSNQIAELTPEEIAALPKGTNLTDNANVKAVLTGGVVIPTQFTYVEGTKDTGVVVSITTNGVESQFVWVPVADVSTMAAQIEKTENYQGKLYGSWTATSSTERTSYGIGTESYREPSLVADYDGLASLYAENGTFYNYFDNANIFGQAMQDDYDEMVKSVIKYGGFYIGRYETSVNGTTVASTIGTESTRPMANKTWYEMYKLQREFSNSDDKLEAVQSSMVWGSQYDTMLNWALTGADATKITEKTNAIHDNSTNGAYRPGTQTVEGKTDKINNIYDLEGNVMEWTLEATYTNVRVLRGGHYFDTPLTPTNRNRTSDGNPTTSHSFHGSRATLYIF